MKMGSSVDYSKYDFSTLAIRAGWWDADPQTGAVSPPIVQSATYQLKRVEEIEEILKSGEFSSRYLYTRGSHPNEYLLEQRIAALEGGEDALCFASGIAAVNAIFTYLVKTGDKVVTSSTLYSGTNTFFRDVLSKFGIEVVYVDSSDPKNFEKAIDERTKVVYLESPANPTISIVDIEAVGQITKKYDNVLTIVDNTFATPYLVNPLRYEGIDVVLHSMTKYICGHTDALGGVLVGKKDLLIAVRIYSLVNLGGVIDPFAAWLITRGLKTLPIRMELHGRNALEVAKFLEKSPKVERVYYPGLDSYPQRAVAKRLFKHNSYGGMLSFELKGGIEAGRTMLNNLKFVRVAASLGDCDTIIEHAASMTHSEFVISREERLKQGITDGLVRLSVGLEGIDDIISDLKQGLDLI
jgi:methionine-gamma-lyase